MATNATFTGATLKIAEAAAGSTGTGPNANPLSAKIGVTNTLQSGTGSAKVDLPPGVYNTSITGSATDTIALDSLADGYQGTITTGAVVRRIVIYNDGSTILHIGGNANPVAMFNPTSGKYILNPGKVFIWESDAGVTFAANKNIDIVETEASTGHYQALIYVATA